VNYKKKICLICGCEYQPTDGKQKWCLVCGPEAHRNVQKKRNKEYYAKNRDAILVSSHIYGMEHRAEKKEHNAAYLAANRKELNEACRKYRLANLDKEVEHHHRWNLEHPGASAVTAKQWREENPGRANELHKNWKLEHPEEARQMALRHAHKRRNLGFVLLNVPFVGCEGHHVDNEQVINMPKELHRSIYHRQDTGQGMAKINAIAYNFLFRQEVETAMIDIEEAHNGET
jgi:hypothetical protein